MRNIITFLSALERLDTIYWAVKSLRMSKLFTQKFQTKFLIIMHEHDVVNKLQRSNNMFVTFRSPKGDTNKKD